MKVTKRLKLLCLILTISMLAWGIHCEESLTASPFSYTTDSPCAPVLRAPGGHLNPHIYNEENNKLIGLGEFTLIRQSPRTASSMRAGVLFVIAFLLTATLELNTIFFSTLFLNGFCLNQYRQRTLNYIHHKDGKKH